MRGWVAGLVVLMIATAASARGKPDAYTTVSIEWMVGTSATILRATVVSIDPDKPSFNYRVDECLLGQADADGVYELAANEKLPAFIVPGRPVLLFISPHDRPDDRYYPPFDLGFVFDPPFWTNLGQPLRSAETLLPALREVIAHAPAGPIRFSASLRPLNDLMKSVLAPRGELFTIPIDERAEPVADQMTASADESLEWQGVYLLAQLPSSKNIKRLRQYLDDPRLRINDSEPLVSPWTELTYYFRQWAADLLKSDGIPLSGIRLTEPGNMYRRVRWWMGAIALLVVIGLWIALGRTRRFHGRGRRVLAMLGVGLLLLCGVWLRGQLRIDDFCYAGGGRLYALSLYRGRVRFEVVYDFSRTTPLAHRAFAASKQSEDPRPWHELSPKPLMGRFSNIPKQRSPILSDSAGYDYLVLDQPLWPLMLLMFVGVAAPSLIAARREATARRRIAHGQCPACGYDLRATPDRCPECGMENSTTDEHR
jgi:hypothetical protein